MSVDKNLTPLRGLVTRAQSGFFEVKTPQGTFTSRIRGRLKRGRQTGDMVAVGDWVQITRVLSSGETTGMIEKVEPRQRVFSRMSPSPRGEYQQVIIANPDQAVLVFACANPAPHLRMLDRFLVIAERQELPVLIVANKLDLVSQVEAAATFGHYAALGYELIYTSAYTGHGVETLRGRLQKKISVLMGPSGVGKSSLLNAVQPGMGLDVSAVSKASRKGRHTTVVRQLFPLQGEGYVADTPGLKALALWDIEPEELDAYFPEIRSLVAECAFSDCTHLHEPNCAVRAAVDAGTIHPERYQSYVRLRLGDDMDRSED